MIQNKAMGSFNCSFMNMDVRARTLGRMFLGMIDFSMGMEPLFFFFRCIFRSERSLSNH